MTFFFFLKAGNKKITAESKNIGPRGCRFHRQLNSDSEKINPIRSASTRRGHVLDVIISPSPTQLIRKSNTKRRSFGRLLWINFLLVFPRGHIDFVVPNGTAARETSVDNDYLALTRDCVYTERARLVAARCR